MLPYANLEPRLIQQVAVQNCMMVFYSSLVAHEVLVVNGLDHVGRLPENSSSSEWFVEAALGIFITRIQVCSNF